MSDENLSRLKNTKRNDACPCGSGRKYKKCHLEEDEAAMRAAGKAAAEAAAKARAAEAEAAGEGEGSAAKDSNTAVTAERTSGNRNRQARSPGQNPRPKNLPRRKAV